MARWVARHLLNVQQAMTQKPWVGFRKKNAKNRGQIVKIMIGMSVLVRLRYLTF